MDETHFPLPETELQKLTEIEAALGTAASRLMARADDFIRANPWEAMGLAGLAGLIFGIWAASRD